MKKKEEWIKKIKKNKLKVTTGRISILEELENASQPISAENLYEILREKNMKVDLSTIYRTLEVLVEKKLVCKINFSSDERKLFAIQGKTHCHYLICKECNKIITIDNCPLAKYEKQLEEETGFEIEEHALYLYGTCKKCAKNKKSGIVSENE